MIRRVLAEAPDEAFGYPDPRGRAELREALAGYLGRARGVRATAASLQVCTGAGHGLGIAFRALAARGPGTLRWRIPARRSSLEQLALARFIETGLFDRHIRWKRGTYRKRRDLLIATLATHAPALRVAGIAAGGHALVRLPPGEPGEHELVAKAALAGLALAPLGDFRVGDAPANRPAGQPALVIGYGAPAGRSYRAAVAALGDFLRSAYPPP